MHSSRRRPEILAPAGDGDALRAAVRAGADAVYFGLKGFNARARAANFDAASLGETMRFLHEHEVKGYVTLNTLVFDEELPRLEEAVRACVAAAADAVIVQDLGVAKLVRAIAPDLPLHASTQMTCTDASSVELAASLGATRVILARELSLADLRAIRARTDVELEVFVHGALCISYSGQCLTSEAIGGRSANRGACAQACRLPYELVVDGVLKDLGDRAYLLSPEDLEASAIVPELVELGVASIKIEGRLKGPDYVAATVALYRRAVDAAAGDGAPPTEEERATALQAYSRGSGVGFFSGVDHQRLVEGTSCDHRGLLAGTSEGARMVRGRRCLAVRAHAEIVRGDGLLVEGAFGGAGELGGRVWAITADGREVERAAPGALAVVWLGPEKVVPEDGSLGRRVWKTHDPAREKAALARIEQAPHRVSLDMHVHGALGEHPVFEARSARGARARVEGDTALAAGGRPGSAEQALAEKLVRLGDTSFVLGKLTVDLPGDALLPVSSINRARRALVSALAAAAPLAHQPPRAISAADLLAAAVPPDRAPPPPGLFVLCRTLPQAMAAAEAGAAGVYLDFLELTGTGAALRALRARGGVQVAVAPPRIRKPGEEKIDRFLRDLAPDAVLVRGLGALHDLGRDPTDGIPRIGDFSLNVANRLAAAEVLARGLVAFTPSLDLDAAQLPVLLSSAFGPYAELVVHHPLPLFHMEHCVIAALLSTGKDHRDCGRPCEHHVLSLRDRAGMDHPVEADVGCRNTVFHAAAQSAANLVASVRQAGTRRFRIELVRETPEDVGRIVNAYRRLIDGVTTGDAVWRELRTGGGYGVVRGSLRVLA